MFIVFKQLQITNVMISAFFKIFFINYFVYFRLEKFLDVLV